MKQMTKMNMVWIAVAKLLHSHTASFVTKKDIDELVFKLFQTKITPAMINSHLVSSVDRQADKANPQRGGSRNRYLYKENNGKFRLYKEADGIHDGWEKTGRICPSIDDMPSEYHYLVTWYQTEYFRMVTKFSKTSPEVINAKLGRFPTIIKSVTRVNGSKYRPGFYYEDMYEIETEDGVYINDGVRQKRDNFTWKINERVEVSTNKDSPRENLPEIPWRWINLKANVSKQKNEEESTFIKLEDVLQGEIPAKHCYVYKLEVGPEIYVGFTSKDPKSRIDKHIEHSKNNAPQEVNKALRKWGYHHTWEIIGKYENEILALLAEKIHIVKLKATLNKSAGGEGDNFKIVEEKCETGEEILYVHDKNGILTK